MGATESRQTVTKEPSPKAPKVTQDPRSPSKEIDRTPLRILESQLVSDPRSPSGDIHRTPIQLMAKLNSRDKDAVRQTLKYEGAENH